MNVSAVQQQVIDALKNGQRLRCVEHTSIGVFGGKLYGSSLLSPKGSVYTSTLKALVKKGYLTEQSREVWHEGENWTMYKLEYKLSEPKNGGTN